MTWLYNFGVKAYSFGIRVASFFNKKAKLWVDGRKGILKKLETAFHPLRHSPTSLSPVIWMHVASLGEFEQGRPIIEKLKEKYPDHKILLTFFSPSGYEIRKNYELADFVFYLPIDSKKNAKRFIEIVHPRLVIFVKYEFWYHYLNTLQSKGIPTILVSALFRPNQLFFKNYGGLFKKMLRGFDHIFVQNQSSFDLLKKHHFQKVTLAGDTRVDRVAAIAMQAKPFEFIEQFAEGQKVLVCGSTWPPDEAVLIDFIKNSEDWKFIIAPHEIGENNINRLQKFLPADSIRYSKAKEGEAKNKKILIIDNIGMLASIYRYGKVAYIGGGFGKGIHNTLEPVAFGLPVIFGPKFKKFEEAITLLEKGGGFSVSNTLEFKQLMSKMNNDNFFLKASSEAKNFITENRGATDQILSSLSKIL